MVKLLVSSVRAVSALSDGDCIPALTLPDSLRSSVAADWLSYYFNQKRPF